MGRVVALVMDVGRFVLMVALAVAVLVWVFGASPFRAVVSVAIALALGWTVDRADAWWRARRADQ